MTSWEKKLFYGILVLGYFKIGKLFVMHGFTVVRYKKLILLSNGFTYLSYEM